MGMQLLYPRLPYLLSSAINSSSSGDNELVAARADHRINIHRIWLVTASAVTLKFKNGAGTDFCGPVSMSQNGGLTFDLTGEPWFTTSDGNSFVLNLSSGVQVSGMVYYYYNR